MKNTPGTFIVIEGTDGSGKGTQFKLLAEHLRGLGHDVETFDFPQYDKPSSYFVREYLNGKYGPAGEVGPYTGSLFYALDRYEAAPAIREALQQGKIVLANRFTGSNMAHQGTSFARAEERRSLGQTQTRIGRTCLRERAADGDCVGVAAEAQTLLRNQNDFSSACSRQTAPDLGGRQNE